MANSVKISLPSIGFTTFIVFLILKLTKVVAWSWWWITVPLWGPIAFILGILIAYAILSFIIAIIAIIGELL